MTVPTSFEQKLFVVSTKKIANANSLLFKYSIDYILPDIVGRIEQLNDEITNRMPLDSWVQTSLYQLLLKQKEFYQVFREWLQTNPRRSTRTLPDINYDDYLMPVSRRDKLILLGDLEAELQQIHQVELNVRHRLIGDSEFKRMILSQPSIDEADDILKNLQSCIDDNSIRIRNLPHCPN
jgi:hypothetical protein